jgi:hypothetical protein
MIRLIASGILLLFVLSAYPQDSSLTHRQTFDTALESALKAIKMTPADLAQRDDYVEKDEYRLPYIDSLMHSPLEMLDISEQLLNGSVPKYSDYIGYKLKKTFLAGNPRDVVRKYTSKAGIDGVTMYRLAYFLSGVEQMKTHELYLSRNAPLLDSLIYGFTILLEEDTLDEFRSVEELDSIGNYEEEWSKVLAEKTYIVSPEVFAMMGESLLDIFKDAIINDEEAVEFKRHYLEFNTKYGKVCIGDDSDQDYSGDLFLVIDYGGNDTYTIDKDGTGNFTFILDYGGDDTYKLPKDRISPYAMGANLIIDFAGDDYYDAGSWALGAGLFGTGILWDKQGNDRYFGDTFTMGAGCFGFGLLRDDAGDDIYDAALFSQGFGFVRGVGVLLDSEGNDHYFAGGKYKDVLRYEDHYLSLSQGFAYGLRPYMSGGIGYLVDRSGNDTYESDIFGQGCSYWWSLGILADGEGNDKYLSFQYAQGAATHMTLGTLYDAGGDDFYLAKGVSQGCGHDRAAGILYDASGSDNYMAYDLSQGAGSANGIGIIADLAGKDAYLVKSDVNTQGYGNPRRDYGSIGIFIDTGGQKDSFAGGPAADSTWWTDSKWGAGIDE